MGFYICENCENIIKDDGNEPVYIHSEKQNRTYYDIKEYKKLKKDPLSDYHIFCSEDCRKKGRKERVTENDLSNSNLIACPDCNKTISKRAHVCPQCGCPVRDVLAESPEEIKTALPDISTPSPTFNAPKCPTCGSTKVHKITMANKAGSVALVGIFALGKVSKTFKCNACGYKW